MGWFNHHLDTLFAFDMHFISILTRYMYTSCFMVTVQGWATRYHPPSFHCWEFGTERWGKREGPSQDPQGGWKGEKDQLSLPSKSMEFPGSPNRWDRWFIITQLAIYTTYILPIGWLYATYHLLRGNSIDSVFFFNYQWIVWYFLMMFLDIHEELFDVFCSWVI